MNSKRALLGRPRIQVEPPDAASSIFHLDHMGRDDYYNNINGTFAFNSVQNFTSYESGEDEDGLEQTTMIHKYESCLEDLRQRDAQIAALLKESEEGKKTILNLHKCVKLYKRELNLQKELNGELQNQLVSMKKKIDHLLQAEALHEQL